MLASGSFTTEASAGCANIEEMFIDSLHIFFNDDLGYAMELGLQYDTGTGGITGVSVTAPSGPLLATPLLLDSGLPGDFETFDGNTIDPDELTGMGFDLSTFRARYPDGMYTFSINDADVGCPTADVTANYAFSAPNGNTRNVFPGSGATINTGRPTAVSVNTCTNCNCREATIDSTNNEAVRLHWDPSFALGLQPNVIRFADFFGMDADGNEGTAGDISASGLPQGEDYVFFSTVGLCSAANVSSCGGGDGNCDLFTGGFEIDVRLFSVGTNTATTADLHEFELGIQELGSKGATTGIIEDEGFYATADLEGDNFSQAILYVPNVATPKTFTFDQIDEFEWRSTVQATHGAALEVFPPTDGESKYVLMVDDGRAAAAVDFVPVQPNGRMTFTGLSDGDTISPTPTFNLNNTCTNCTLAVLVLEDFLTDGDVLDSEADKFQPAAGPIVFVAPDEFDGLVGPLTQEDYLVTSEVLEEKGFFEGEMGVPLLVATTGEDGFDHFGFDTTFDIIRVTVPEPGWLVMQVASQAGLALLPRGRRLG